MVCPFQLHDASPDMKTIQFSCDLCSFQGPAKGDITLNPFCRQQFLQVISFIDSSLPCRFNTRNQLVSLPAQSTKILKDYIATVTKHEKRIQDIFRQHPEIKQKLYSDPVAAYQTIISNYNSTSKRVIREFIKDLETTSLISLLNSQFGDNHSFENRVFYEVLLKIQRTPIGYDDYKSLEEDCRQLSSYDVGPFNINIYEYLPIPLEKYYRASVRLDEILSPRILQYLFSHHSSNHIEGVQLQNLDELLDRKISDFQNYLRSNFVELTDEERKNLAIFATAQSIGLIKTIPLLLDDDVQEVYLDKPGNAYYIDHAVWGRCKSNLVPSDSELSHIITRLRLESRRPLDEKTPSLKTELQTSLFHVRAAVDIPPLAHEGPHLNIRKIRMRTLTLPELIRNGTISLTAAAFLILCMTLRINITIGGEPATGKTTLDNAINLLAPPNWRRIAIEDALESVTVNERGRHKVTFRVDPFDSLEKSGSTKSKEIIRLLHRSPDWVFLGEIQTAEHSDAMFHALSAGIRGIQTCHANSNNELLLRWKIHHNIPEVCFESLGLLVHMVKDVIQGRIIRRVAQISEVKHGEACPSLVTLYDWNKVSEHLEQQSEDIITPLIIRACQFQKITQLDVRKRFKTYKETLATLISKQEDTPSTIVSTFDKTHAHIFSGTKKALKAQSNKNTNEGEAIGLHQITG